MGQFAHAPAEATHDLAQTQQNNQHVLAGSTKVLLSCFVAQTASARNPHEVMALI